MYKGHKVKELLKERGLSARDLLDHLGVKENGTIARFTGPDIKASRLEQIADFFGVATDYFFDRGGDVNIALDGAVATNGATANYTANLRASSSKVRDLDAKVKYLEGMLREKASIIQDKETIIREKDERIKLLEKMLEINEQNAKTTD